MTYWPDPPSDGPDLDDDFIEWCEANGWDPEDDDAPQGYEQALREDAEEARAEARLEARSERWD